MAPPQQQRLVRLLCVFCTALLPLGAAYSVTPRPTRRTQQLASTITSSVISPEDADFDFDLGQGGVRLAQESAIKIQGKVEKKKKAVMTALLRYRQVAKLDGVPSGSTILASGKGTEEFSDPTNTGTMEVVLAPIAAAQEALEKLSDKSSTSKIVVNIAGGDDLQSSEVLQAVKLIADAMPNAERVTFSSLSDASFPMGQAALTIVQESGGDEEAETEIYAFDGSYYATRAEDLNDAEDYVLMTDAVTNEPNLLSNAMAGKQRLSAEPSRSQNDGESDRTELEMLPLTGGSNGEEADERDGLFHMMDKDTHSRESSHVLEKATGDWWQDFLYPPGVPRRCQLLRPENLAVPLCYLLVGLLQGLSSTITNTFPKDLAATQAQQTTVQSIRSLPASFKLLFGFISDIFPVLGYRRKPYMFVGWLLSSVSMLAVIMSSDLSIVSTGCFQSEGESQADVIANIPENAPSMGFLSVCMLLFGTGFWMADVMGDSIVAEKAKLEPESSRGSIQSSCYSYRFFGMMLASPLSTYLYTYAGPYYVFLLLAMLPLTILPFVMMLGEEKDLPVAPVSLQCNEIWNTVCSRAAWQPMAFVYIYNAMQIGNAAWREFLTYVLEFTSCQLNLMVIMAHILLYLGVITYKYLMMDWSWRKVYILTTTLNGFFSLLQVLLIYGITFGIPNFLFALGDEAFADFLGGIQFLPTTIMMVHLCPAGSEGASYAMFTTVNNGALAVASALSTMLLPIWDVDRDTMMAGHLSGITKLTLLTTAFQVGAIVFVCCLPNYRTDLEALKEDSHKSKVGGFIFLFITFSSILYSLRIGIMNIVYPGWMGES